MFSCSALGEELKEARQELGWSLREVQHRTGVTASTLSFAENGRAVLWTWELESLARFYPESCWVHQHHPGHQVPAEESARATDPEQSHEVARSISEDTTMAGRICALAEEWWPRHSMTQTWWRPSPRAGRARVAGSGT